MILNTKESKEWLADNLMFAMLPYQRVIEKRDADGNLTLEIYHDIDRRRVKRIIRKLCADC